MNAEHPSTTWHDEPALRIPGGGGLEMLVVPGRGGKIASIRDAAGREWLAGPSTTLPTPARGPAVFTDAEMCGWDECVPNVDADVLDGVPLPDHGQSWTSTWADHGGGTWGYDGQDYTAQDSAGAGRGYRFTRRVEPTRTGLALVYRAETLGDTAVPFQWTAHPQLVAGPGARIALPPLVHDVDGIFGVDGRQPWSGDLADVDAVADGAARKFWVAHETPASWVGLVRADGSTLRLSWDPELVPYLALWVDARMFSRERVVGLEPSTGYREALSTSRAADRCAWLRPGRPLAWTLEVEVTPAP